MATTGLGAQKFKVSSLSTFCANFSVSLLLWGPPLCQVGQGTNPVMSVAQLPRKPAATSDSFCCFLQKQCKHYRACHSTPSPSAKPHALHPLTSVHLPYRDGGCTSPLPQHCWAQMQTGTIRPQAQRWGPSHTHCPPPTPPLGSLNFSHKASGQQETEVRRRQLSADTGEAAPMLHAAQAPENPRGSLPMASG